MVNNAEIYEYLSIEELTKESTNRLQHQCQDLYLPFKGNLFGDNSSVIIKSNSEAGKTPLLTGSLSSASKAALDADTVFLSKEFIEGILGSHSILLGVVETERSRCAGFIGGEMETNLVDKTPLGRKGQPEDIAKVAYFLLPMILRGLEEENIGIQNIYGFKIRNWSF